MLKRRGFRRGLASALVAVAAIGVGLRLRRLRRRRRRGIRRARHADDLELRLLLRHRQGGLGADRPRVREGQPRRQDPARGHPVREPLREAPRHDRGAPRAGPRDAVPGRLRRRLPRRLHAARRVHHRRAARREPAVEDVPVARREDVRRPDLRLRLLPRVQQGAASRRPASIPRRRPRPTRSSSRRAARCATPGSSRSPPAGATATCSSGTCSSMAASCCRRRTPSAGWASTSRPPTPRSRARSTS